MFYFRFILSMLYINAICSAGSAKAEEHSAFSPSWYIGANVAKNDGQLFSNCNDRGPEGLVDGLNAGYQFSSYLAADIEYQYLGCIPVAEEFTVFRQGVVSAKVSYPITKSLSPYLKIGGSGWFRDGSEGIAGVAGGGLSYHIDENLSFNLEYQYTNSIGNDVQRNSDHRRWSLGVQYRFGNTKPQVSAIKKHVVQNTTKNEIVKTKAKTLKSNNIKSLFFDSNSSTLNDLNLLNNIINKLNQQSSLVVSITGHADNTGDLNYNLLLSMKRAQMVRQYLLEHGIESNRITYQAKGSLEPIASNETADGQKKNRRVVIELFNKLN